MINHIRGIIDSKTIENIVIEANGVGYTVSVPISTFEKLPSEGSEVKLYISESTAMYGGSTSLYGFLSEDERNIFLLLKEVPGTGARKALDYLDKVTKSLPDFRRCVLDKDITSLTGIFGFTKKTAEKLAAALKDKIAEVPMKGKEKWVRTQEADVSTEAIAGLVALGYRDHQAREAVQKALEGAAGDAAVEEIIRRSLKHL